MAVDIVLTRQSCCPAFFLPTLPKDRIAWHEGTSEDLKKFKKWFKGWLTSASRFSVLTISRPENPAPYRLL
jgi:hypothetical protein